MTAIPATSVVLGDVVIHTDKHGGVCRFCVEQIVDVASLGMLVLRWGSNLVYVDKAGTVNVDETLSGYGDRFTAQQIGAEIADMEARP